MNHKPLYKAFFVLLIIPAFTGSLLLVLMSRLADAAESSLISESASCDAPANLRSDRWQPVRLSQHPDRTLIASAGGSIEVEHPMLDFTAAESDAAVALFGCDCLPCISALRQLRSRQTLSQALQVNTLQASREGHCWSSLQQRRSPQEVEDLLQQLNTSEISS